MDHATFLRGILATLCFVASIGVSGILLIAQVKECEQKGFTRFTGAFMALNVVNITVALFAFGWLLIYGPT